MGPDRDQPIANGADCYRIIDPKDAPRGVPKQPKGEMKDRVGAIFFRRPTTMWNADEIKAFRALTFDPAELTLVEEFYRSEAGKEGSYTRTSLLTFLRHYPGEVDRAKRWKENSRKKHCY